MKGWMYILECCDGSYYTGSTNNIELRLQQHQSGEGANHTKKRLPVKLVYFEEFERIDEAFNREKQVQGWSRKKKEALINSKQDKLPELSMAYRDIKVASRTSATEPGIEALEVPAKRTSATEPGIEALEVPAKRTSATEASATGAPLPEVLEGNSNKI